MADIATLGIEVKSDAGNAAKDLDKLSGAAARAQAQTEGLTSANRGAVGAASASAKAYADTGKSAASASKQIELMEKAANQNGVAQSATAASSKKFAYQSKMVALQLSQVAQQTQATGNFIQALAIQLPDMALGFGTVGIAIGVLLGVLLPLLDLPKRIAQGLRLLADNLQTIAPYAVAAAAALALLYAPQIFGGIVSLIALLGRLVVQLGIVAGSFLLANPAVLFVAGIAAAVAAIGIFRDELTQILGVDIVEVAKKGANLVIGSFAAAFHDIVFIWNNFGNIVGLAVQSAVNAVIKGVNEMIKQAATGVDTLIGAMNKIPGIKINPIGDVGDTIKPWNGGFEERMQRAVGDRNKMVNDDLSRDWVGNIGTGIQKSASKAAGAVKDLANWMDKVDAKDEKKGSDRDANHYRDLIKNAHDRIDQMKLEAQTAGETGIAAETLSFKLKLLQDATDKGRTVTASQRAEIEKLADAYKEAATAAATAKLQADLAFQQRQMGRSTLDQTVGSSLQQYGLPDDLNSYEAGLIRANEQMKTARELAGDFASTLTSGLRNGEGLWKSFGNAALSVLNKITDALLNDVLNALFKVGSAGSSGGGWLSSLLGLGSSPSSGFDIGSDAVPFKGFANGTSSAPGGLAWVGERGPELVNLPRGSQVVPNHRLTAANQNDASGSTSGVHVTVGVTVDQNGNLKAYVKNVAQSEAKDAVGQYDSQVLPSRVNQINKDPRAR